MSAMSKAHALVVGIASYHHVTSLPPSVLSDAQGMQRVLADLACCAFPSANVRLILDRDATRETLSHALVDLSQCVDADSTVFLYISSHGGRIESGPFAGEYLLPVDAELDVTVSPPCLKAETAISGSEFAEALRRIPARRMIVVLDCCHAGGLGQAKDALGSRMKAGFSEAYFDRLAEGRGRVILAACRDTEFSYVLPGAANSLFTQHLLAGLQGNAPGPGGVIRIFDLFHYLQPKVTADCPQQHPIFKAELEENFPVALYPGGKAPELAVPPLEADAFRYDVFLSYRQQEPVKTWVRKALLPGLEAQGLRVCIDQRDFRLGASLVKEMERAVEQSRYTLAVLSPAYLTSNFTDLENILAEYLGLEKSQRRLLAVLREPCTPRLGMRARLWLDMTEDGDFEMNMARLVYELRQPPDL